jgi:hypothetical protein
MVTWYQSANDWLALSIGGMVVPVSARKVRYGRTYTLTQRTFENKVSPPPVVAISGVPYENRFAITA